MSWIYRISHLSLSEKKGFYRLLIPSSLYHRYLIDPISFYDEKGERVVRFFCPPGDRTCLVEIKLPGIAEPLFSTQLSDTNDLTQLDWDFVIVNDPESPKFNTQVDRDGRDTLFGWANRALDEEEKSLEAGLFPGQARKGLGLTHETILALENFCRIFDIKSIRLEALFYHNAISYESHGFSYFSGYRQMRRIHELFQPGAALFRKLDGSTPFRKSESARTVRGRSWAIHDGILLDVDDDVLGEGWRSPVLYKMVENPRGMVTFPDPIF